MRGQIKEHIQESMQAQVAEAATEHAPAASSSQRYSSLQDLTGQCLRDRSSDTSSRHSTSALNAPKAQVPRRPRPGQSLGVSLPESATTQETRQTSLCTLRQPEPREDPSASRSPRRPGIHAHTHKHTNTHRNKHTITNRNTHTVTHTQTHRHKQSPAQTRTDTHPTAGTTHGQEQKGASARTGPQETYLAAQESEAAPTTQPLRARMQLRTLVEARKQRCHKASGPGELPKDTKPSARCQVKHGPCSGESTWIPIDAAQCAHWAEKLAQTASSDAKKKFRKVYIYYKGQKYRANVGFLQTLSAKGIPHEHDIYQRTKTPQRRGGAASGAGRSPPARAPSIEASPTRA